MITNPNILMSCEEIFANPCPIPEEPGVYGWFFKDVPSIVPLTNCVYYNGLWLLYVGISPKRPPKTGKPSKENLRFRIRYHYHGNAEGSTLRLTLGCLLSDQLSLELRRVGSGKRMTFTNYGEQLLSSWMAENAFVTWEVHPEPWIYEDELINKFGFPLNIQGNMFNTFRDELSRIRSEAKQNARTKPVFKI
jgi:GIY-YIG catalytic domain